MTDKRVIRQSRRIAYDDVDIKLTPKIGNGGEIIGEEVTAKYNPDKYCVTKKKDPKKIPKKAGTPYTMVNRDAYDGLENNARLVYSLLIDYISWQDNFIRNKEDGSLLSVLQFTELINKNKEMKTTRKHITAMLKILESKERIKIIDLGNVLYIYLLSKFVWFGYEKNRNDKVLENFIKQQT